MIKNTYYLFLDDERFPKDVISWMKNDNLYLKNYWIIIRDFDEFTISVDMNYVAFNDFPKVISFDHDLGDGKTGFDCAKWLIEYCMDKNLELPTFYVHSMNPVGKENIEKLLMNFRKFQEDDNN